MPKGYNLKLMFTTLPLLYVILSFLTQWRRFIDLNILSVQRITHKKCISIYKTFRQKPKRKFVDVSNLLRWLKLVESEVLISNIARLVTGFYDDVSHTYNQPSWVLESQFKKEGNSQHVTHKWQHIAAMNFGVLNRVRSQRLVLYYIRIQMNVQYSSCMYK